MILEETTIDGKGADNPLPMEEKRKKYRKIIKRRGGW